jgi:hypothetical protein
MGSRVTPKRKERHHYVNYGAEMRGYIYVLTNVALPSLVKIGFSTKDPRERASELSGTSIPSQFHVHYEALVEQPSAVERMLHDTLRDFRHRSDREFFTLEPPDAVHRIRAALEAYGCNPFFEPRATYCCAACMRWSFAEQCDCKRRTLSGGYGLPADLRRLAATLARESPEVGKWLRDSRREGLLAERGTLNLKDFASSLATRMASTFETDFALPVLLLAGYMDDCVSQGWLAAGLADLERDPRERYFWARLESSNPDLRPGTRRGGWLIDFDWLVRKVGIDAARETEERAAQWIARNRSSGCTADAPAAEVSTPDQ